MLKGPFRTDKKFIKYCNENVVHLIRFEGPKGKTAKVKHKGKWVERDYYIPRFTAAQLNEIGDDAITFVRDDKAPREYRLPRLEIWSADQKLLHAYGPGSKVISNAYIMKAAKGAQKKLGAGMKRKPYRVVAKLLARLDAAIEAGKRSEIEATRKKLLATKGITPALRKSVEERVTAAAAGAEPKASK